MTETERIYYLLLAWVQEIDRRLTEGSIHIWDTSSRLITTLADLMAAIEMGTVDYERNLRKKFNT